MYDITQSSFVDSFHEGGRFISEALIIESHRLGGLKIISKFICSQWRPEVWSQHCQW